MMRRLKRNWYGFVALIVCLSLVLPVSGFAGEAVNSQEFAEAVDNIGEETPDGRETVEPDGKETGTAEPDMAVPDTEESGTEEPDTGEADIVEPGAEEIGTEEPDTEEPDTVEPDTEEPDTEEPDIEEPDTEEPDTVEPDTEGPDTAQPDGEEANPETPEETAPGIDETAPETPDTLLPEQQIPAIENPDADLMPASRPAEPVNKLYPFKIKGTVGYASETEAIDCGGPGAGAYGNYVYTTKNKFSKEEGVVITVRRRGYAPSLLNITASDGAKLDEGIMYYV